MNTALHLAAPAWLTTYVGQRVIADLEPHHLVIGTLAVVGHDHLEFTEADLHDHREANSSKEVYALESASIGIRTNRTRVAIPLFRLIALSRLEDLAP